MLQADQHQYQVLTKRSKKMVEFSLMFKEYFGHKIPPYIWMGVSVENAKYKGRIDDLRKVKCHTRFLSIEPLLGPVGKLNLKGIDWVIIGGESGYGFRPVKKEWIIDIIRQCRKQKVAIFFKQWGGIRPKSGGRTINGRMYDEYPEIPEVENILKEVAYNEKEFASFCKAIINKKIIKDTCLVQIPPTSKRINFKRT
jgi:protein gp37